MLSPFRALYLASFLMLLFMRRHTSALVNPLCPSSLARYRSIRALSATKEQGKGKQQNQQNQQNQQKKGAGKGGKKEDDETRIVPRDEDVSLYVPKCRNAPRRSMQPSSVLPSTTLAEKYILERHGAPHDAHNAHNAHHNSHS